MRYWPQSSLPILRAAGRYCLVWCSFNADSNPGRLMVSKSVGLGLSDPRYPCSTRTTSTPGSCRSSRMMASLKIEGRCGSSGSAGCSKTPIHGHCCCQLDGKRQKRVAKQNLHQLAELKTGQSPELCGTPERSRTLLAKVGLWVQCLESSTAPCLTWRTRQKGNHPAVFGCADLVVSDLHTHEVSMLLVDDHVQ